MKIWMSENNRAQKAKLTLFGSLLVLGLCNIILLVPSILFFHDSTGMLLLYVIFATAMNVYCALRIGSSRTRDQLLFLRDDQMALFVVDLSKFVRYRRGLLGLYLMERDKERILNSAIIKKKFETYLMQKNSLHGLETEIKYVERMKERRDGVQVVCHVIYPNRNKGRVSYFIKNGYENQEALILELERRVPRYGEERNVDRSHKGHLLISSILLLADIALCLMSHPVLGMIDVSFYFYFLAAFFPIVCYFLTIVLTIRRGL